MAPLLAPLGVLFLLTLCHSLHYDVPPAELLNQVRDALLRRPEQPVNAHVVLLGDSATRRFFEPFKLHFPPRKSWLVAGQCERGKFFNITQPTQMATPTMEEGPTDEGLGTLGCSDCTGCFSRLWDGDPLAAPASLDYITMEYARDVEIQSPQYRTTQENLAYLFLKQRYQKERFYIVVNIGLHDCKMGEERYWVGLGKVAPPGQPETAEVYFERNLPFVLRVFKEALPNAVLIWFGISIHTDFLYQTDERLLAMDNLGIAAARKWGWHTLQFFNASKGLKALHVDSLHHSQIYYRAQARALARFIQQIQQTELR